MLGTGKSIWVGGATGQGTGRTSAWNTWDGSHDTAWQTLVDETSTAISTDYQPSANNKNAIRIGNERSLITLENANNVSVGVVRFDAIDPTSAQVQLYGSTNLGNYAGLQFIDASYYLLSSTVDAGCIFPFKYDEGTDTITTGNKISGLLLQTSAAGAGWISGTSIDTPWHDTVVLKSNVETDAELVTNCWTSNGTGDGPDFNSAACQTMFNSSKSSSYRGLIMTAQDTDQNTEREHLIQWDLPADLNDLIVSPSNALSRTYPQESTFNGTWTSTSGAFAGSFYLDSNGPLYDSSSKMDEHMRLFARILPSYWQSGDSTYHLTGFMWKRNESYDAGGSRLSSVSWVNQGIRDYGVQREFSQYYTPYYLGNVTSLANNYWQDMQYFSAWNNSTADFKTRFISAVQDGDAILGFYSDEDGTNEDDTSCKMYITAGRLGGWETADIDDGTGTLRSPKELAQGGGSITHDMQIRTEFFKAETIYDAGNLAKHSTGADNVHAASNVVVSTGTDSSAIDEGYPMLLGGNKIAYIYRKGTTLYWSVFGYSLPADTTLRPAVTRLINGASLGTVPAKRISGSALGNGVAYIVVGNTYKIVKVPN